MGGEPDDIGQAGDFAGRSEGVTGKPTAHSTQVMRTAPASLTGVTLGFDRAGTQLIVGEPDAIAVVEIASGKTCRLPYTDARAIAGFDDQVWIATHDDQLVRVDPGGRRLGEAVALPFSARGMLIPAACGPAAAVWSAAPPVALIDDFGALASVDLGDIDAAIPLTGRRCIVARGPKITLPSGVVTQLPPSSSVLGGMVMADGKAVTLLVTRDGGRQLVIVSLTTGQIVQRVATPTATVRIAAKSYLAVVQMAPMTLWVLDLRTGRDVGMITRDHAIRDHAIDPSGRRLAIRSDSGAIELHVLDELLRRPADKVVVEQAAPPVETNAPTVSDVVAPPMPIATPRATPRATPLPFI